MCTIECTAAVAAVPFMAGILQLKLFGIWNKLRMYLASAPRGEGSRKWAQRKCQTIGQSWLVNWLTDWVTGQMAKLGQVGLTESDTEIGTVGHGTSQTHLSSSGLWLLPQLSIRSSQPAHTHTHTHTQRERVTQKTHTLACCCLCFLLVNELVPPFVASLASFSVFIDSRPFFTLPLPPAALPLPSLEYTTSVSTHTHLVVDILSMKLPWNGQSKVGSNLSKFCKPNASNRFAFRIRIQFWFRALAALADNGVKSFLIRFVSRANWRDFRRY